MRRKNQFCILLFFAAFWICLCCTFVQAQDIRFEGENYDFANSGNVKIIADKAASGGAYLSLQYSAGINDCCEITYNIDAQTEGFYSLWVESTRVDYQWNSNYKISVNNSETIDVRKKAVAYSSDFGMPSSRKMELGSVYLKHGSNEIKFIVDKRRTADNQICFYLDYFELKPAEVYLRNITGKSANNIFEKKTGAVFEADTNVEMPKDDAVDYCVYDYTGNSVKTGVLTLKKGEKLHSLILADLNYGWYRIVFDYGDNSWEMTFSVVHNAEERTISDSPFGLDFAGQWHILDKDDKKDYMRAAKLTGITWLRERLSWGGIEQQNGIYSYDEHDMSVNMPSENGIKLLEVFHDTPSWYSGNLFDVYDFTKTLGEHYLGKINALEIWNEADIGFGEETADRFSALFKAAAIGAADSGSGMLKMNGGWAETPITTDTNSTYSEQCLKNDIADYSDTYAYHSYGQVGSQKTNHGNDSGNNSHSLASDWYNLSNKPKWVTEGGFWLSADAGEQHSLSNQLLQARGLIISLVKSVAAGNKKHFWFVLFNRYESFNRCQFGLLNEKGTPYMSYAAYSNLTYQLGNGTYKGRMANLPESAKGYLFNSGIRDTAVLWSENETEYTITNVDSLIISDLMGREKVIRAENKKITVSLNENPIFIQFNGFCAMDNYEPFEVKETKEAATLITSAQRIVVNPKFLGESDDDVKLGGYYIPKNQPQKFAVEVYNFNGRGTEVVLNAQIGDGYAVTPQTQSVYVPAMDKIEVNYEVSAAAETNRRAYFTIGGTVNGEEISKSVLKLKTDSIWIEPSGYISGFSEAWRWQTWYVTNGAKVSAQTGNNEITFSLKFDGGDRWFYPHFQISDAERRNLSSMTGISFEIEFPDEISGTINALFGSFLQNPIPIKKGVQRIQIPFTEFKSDVDFDNLEYVSLGVNVSTDDSFSYTIRNFGYYGKKEADNIIRLDGVADEQVFKNESISAIATVPTNADVSTLKVLLNHQPYYNYTLNGKIATINLSGLKRGEYELFVGVNTTSNSAERKSIRFYVDDDSERLESICRIEGENCEKANYITYMTGEQWSGGLCMEMHRGEAPESEYRIDYKVCVPADGMYRLTAYAGYGDWFSPVKIRVNEEEYSLKALSNDKMYVNQAAKIRLNAGENVISFVVSEHRAADTQYCFHMDYFDLDRVMDEWVSYQPFRIEGENYISADYAMKLTQSWNASDLDFGNLSGKNGLKMESTSEPPKAVYQVSVEQDGYYRLTMVCSPPEDTATYCQMKMTVNGQEYLLNSENTSKISDDSFYCDGKFGYYSYNISVLLKSGINDITLSAVSPRTYDGLYYFYMDYIDFSYQSSDGFEFMCRQYLAEGDKEQIYIRTSEDFMGEDIYFESDSPEIFSVDSNGRIYAKKTGNAVLTVTILNRQRKIPITVYDKSGLTLSNSETIENYSSNSHMLIEYTAKYEKENDVTRLSEVQVEDIEILPGMFFNIIKPENQKIMFWDDGLKPIFPAIQN